MKGGWRQTATGQQLWVLAPGEAPISIEDIAHHLAQTNRFGGAAPFPYTVAQHSILVSLRVTELALLNNHEPRQVRRLSLQGLLHDAAEAIVGDVVRPLKGHLSVPEMLIDFPALEEVWLSAIMRQFGLPETLSPEVLQADDEMLATEAKKLFPEKDRPADWCLKYKPLNWYIDRWEFEGTKSEFLRRFVELGGVP